MDNFKRIEAGKPKVKVPALGEGLLAAESPEVKGRTKSMQERVRGIPI